MRWVDVEPSINPAALLYPQSPPHVQDRTDGEHDETII